ncbi:MULTISPECIES: KilA-N domain-containing protein [Cyanophyceae]|uniref:KilA-N domain-containing protein n=1 Tax=Cyanophyceae TaxID=3028117 RepID=UPI00168422E3|nr:KilA-N domain-containing protein [Trichocoleus sp. FACHB-69]MBD1935627.1 KilA-N domain-containing protein [Trichocoleus sp. FACHB-69]
MEIPNNWVNLTEIAKASGRRFNDFHRLKSSEALLDKLELKHGTPQIIVIQGGTPEIQGSWGSPELAEFVMRWADSPKSANSYRFEAYHKEILAAKLGGDCCVWTPAGECDVVTKKYAIGVKEYRSWKHAIGQAQTYAYYLKKTPAIYLIGTPPNTCREVCQYLKVAIIE